MSYDILIAIDPGPSGAIAVMEPGVYTSCRVFDCPTFLIKKSGSKTARNVSDPVGMASLLKNLCDKYTQPIVFIELVHARENDSKVSAFAFGENYGMWEGIIAALKLPIIRVSPTAWKRVMVKRTLMGMTPTDLKEESRKKCLELLPHLSEELKYKKSHNRAEAALLALYAEWHILNKNNKEVLQKGYINEQHE